MSHYFGIAKVTINGSVINSQPGATIDPGGVTRSTVTTDQESGHTEALRPAKVNCKIMLQSGVSLVDLNDISGATIQFIADTGQSYVLSNAWRVGAISASGGESGGIDLEFNANLCTEVGA